tara:strand:+ start:252 stop:509 length:258 start_codon:yes stop_codon:yes gene_type:complete
MKNFNQFQEDAKAITSFKDTLMNNPTIKNITSDLKSGKIDINKIKGSVQSEKGKKDLENLRKTGLNTLIKVGQGYLDRASQTVNK